MQRALPRLSTEVFDVLIIGGGATGCFTARDAAMRGLKVALVEARDFASATSAHNSKLAHGGLRYLRNFEISLVRESLRERLGLMRIAPHLVRPLPFLLPQYHAGAMERTKLAAGPWADLFLEQATGSRAAHRLIRSKGIHLLVPQLSRAALTIEAGNGHLFALPWRGHTLLATTDSEFTGDPATLAVTEKDIAD